MWSIDKKDFFLWAITFITTLIFGIEIGVLVGVSVNLLLITDMWIRYQNVLNSFDGNIFLRRSDSHWPL